MKKFKIYTMYERAPRLNKDKVYDSRDNVDRLSYVDNTTMIKRFVMEGKNLALARSKALKSGLYSGNLKEIDEDTGYAMPVFEIDPAVARPMITAMTSELSAKQVAVHEAQSDNNSVAVHEAQSDNNSNDSVVPNPTADVSDAKADGVAYATK